MINAALYSTINIFCILLLGIILIKILMNSERQNSLRLFMYVLICNIIFFTSDLIWILIDHNLIPSTIAINYVVNCIYFIMTGISGYFWFVYSETIQNSFLVRNKTILSLFSIPFLLLTILVINSPITGWIFYIEPDNSYHRGAYYIIQPIIGYGYIAITTATALIKGLQKENTIYRKKYLSLTLFAIFPAIAIIIQALCPGLPLLSMGITLPLIFIYITSLELQISLDSLTALNNRQCFLEYITCRFQNPKEYKELYLVLMDVDFLKKINSQYGHTEGDEALVRVSNALKDVVRHTDYFICRYGADEFIAVCEVSHYDFIKDFIKTVTKEIHASAQKAQLPYPLTISFGCAKYTPEISSVAELIHQADADLYQKQKIKLH